MAAKMFSKQNIAMGVLVVATTVCATGAHAVDLDMGASIEFVPALSITKSDIEFGSIEYTPGAGANDVTLSAADGSLNCSNTAEYTCPASATPGKIGIVGGSGYAVNIFCGDGGSLSNGTDTFDMKGVELAYNSSTFSCAGMGQAATTHTIDSNAEQNKFEIGGKIEIPASGVGDGGVFTTAQSGGAAINVRVVYQ